MGLLQVYSAFAHVIHTLKEKCLRKTVLDDRMHVCQFQAKRSGTAFSRVLLFTKPSKINIPPQAKRKKERELLELGASMDFTDLASSQGSKTEVICLCRHGQLPVIRQMTVR